MEIAHLTQAFEEYVSAYDLTDPKIKLKYIHTKKVAENARQIAKSLNLSKEDQDLCWKIGMLHDIGRFEQARRFNTFNDADSVNHAIFGADLLFKESLIEKFDPDSKNYNLLEKTIRYHNRYELPDDLNDRENLFCQIIRDADKIDIYRAVYTSGMEDIYNVSTTELKNASITPVVYEAFKEKHTILRTLIKTIMDHLIGLLSLYYGLEFPESKKMTVEQGYIWKLASFHSDNPETEEILDRIRETLKQEWQ